MSTIESWFCRSTPWEAATGRWVLPWALQGVRSRGRVLEIGGGGGAMAAQILTRSSGDVEVTVTDFDPVMVAAAAAERLQGFGSRAHARVADATALPFGDGAFDMVVSFIMLHPRRRLGTGPVRGRAGARARRDAGRLRPAR
ncbi:class I SAM-dependent methyltransferase [Gordonia sp. GAMMA]|uniref:class I SAM-dependent methyltransferase n=1 Tax=Gordonia sp. GAMMA TaxID=2502241 RepID=UPI0024C3277F|nr:class I SAM-dependent methyltransferase [Gordonia sp. GAMMA]